MAFPNFYFSISIFLFFYCSLVRRDSSPALPPLHLTPPFNTSPSLVFCPVPSSCRVLLFVFHHGRQKARRSDYWWSRCVPPPLHPVKRLFPR